MFCKFIDLFFVFGSYLVKCEIDLCSFFLFYIRMDDMYILCMYVYIKRLKLMCSELKYVEYIEVEILCVFIWVFDEILVLK